MFYLVRGGLIKWQTRMTSVESRVALLHQILFKNEMIHFFCGFRLSLDNTDDEGNEIKGQVVSIDTGSPVNSAGFGSGTPENQLADPPQRQYWTRFDFSNKELVFATGHVNGRVRIWDVYTGNNSTNLCLFNLKKCYHISSCGVKRAQVARADGSHSGCS